MTMQSQPVCLTIAGSDSGGGAGIQADLKTLNWHGTFGTSVITAVTAQNTATVLDIHAVPVSTIIEQFCAVVTGYPVAAIKTGMLYSSEIVSTIAEAITLIKHEVPVVVDPVMVAASGSELSRRDAMRALTDELIPLAAIVTPNLSEAEALLSRSLPRSTTAMVAAARELSQQIQSNVLLKGGHLGLPMAIDILVVNRDLYQLQTPMVESGTSHGTGCMLSAAIAANLATGYDLTDSARRAKAFIYQCLRNRVEIANGLMTLGLAESVDEDIVEMTRLAS